MNHIFADKREQMRLIQKSGLEWIIVRPPRLTQSPKTGKYKITEGRPAARSVPRNDVADFMLKLLKDKKYDGKMPAISSHIAI